MAVYMNCKAERSNLVIYELLVRDFLQDHTMSSLQRHARSLANLGVNAIESMPVDEFEGEYRLGI